MAKAETTVRAAAFSVGGGIAARVIGVVSTLIITRYLDPDIMGEVMSASIVVFSANMLTNFGLGNYAIAKFKDGPDVTFASTVLYMGFGILAFIALLLWGGKLGSLVGAPEMGRYVPGLVLAAFLRRIGHMPDKVLARDMRFGAIAYSVALSELAFAVVSVLLAMRGWGGDAIVWANVVQGAVMSGIVISQVHWRTWLGPHKIRWARIKDQANYGLPLGMVASVHYASTTWDNLLYARYFGVHQMGLYNLGYKLAAMPAQQIGEQVGGVLFPSMSGVDGDAKRRAIVRSTGLMGLLVFPLGLGLFAISDSLIATILTEEWQGVAPVLSALALITLVQPIGWTAGPYLLAKGYNWALSVQEFVRFGVTLAGIVIFAPYGPIWACAGVGLAHISAAVIDLYLLTKDGVSFRGLLNAMLRPIVPGLPMVAAVFAVRHGLMGIGVERPIVLLLAEIAAGALVFVPSAFLFCGPIARDFLGLIKSTLGFGDSEEEGESEDEGDARAEAE